MVKRSITQLREIKNISRQTAYFNLFVLFFLPFSRDLNVLKKVKTVPKEIHLSRQGLCEIKV